MSVGNVPYNYGEVGLHLFKTHILLTYLVKDQLIDVFKSVGQVVGFRWHRSEPVSVMVLKTILRSPLATDWFLTGTQANRKDMAFVNSLVLYSIQQLQPTAASNNNFIDPMTDHNPPGNASNNSRQPLHQTLCPIPRVRTLPSQLIPNHTTPQSMLFLVVLNLFGRWAT